MHACMYSCVHVCMCLIIQEKIAEVCIVGFHCCGLWGSVLQDLSSPSWSLCVWMVMLASSGCILKTISYPGQLHARISYITRESKRLTSKRLTPISPSDRNVSPFAMVSQERKDALCVQWKRTIMHACTDTFMHQYTHTHTHTHTHVTGVSRHSLSCIMERYASSSQDTQARR
jgi:hypothetical protein